MSFIKTDDNVKLFYFRDLDKEDYIKLGFPESLANAVERKLKEIEYSNREF